MRLLPFRSNLEKNHKVGHNSSENEKLKRFKFLDTSKYNRKNYKIDTDGDKDVFSLMHSPFRDIDNSTFVSNPSHFSCINKRGLHKSNSNNMKGELNEEFNNNANTFIQIAKVEIVDRDALDYMDTIDEKGDATFSLQPQLIDIYICKEIKRFIEYYDEVNGRYTKEYLPKIEDAFNYMNNIAIHCISDKKDLTDLVNILEYPKYYNKQIVQYSKKYNEYKPHINKYVNCLKTQNNNYKTKITEIVNSIKKLLEDIPCSNECDTSKYSLNIKHYLLQFNDFSYNSNISFMKSSTDFLNSGVNLIELIEKELEKTSHTYSIRFILEEIKEIIDRYNFHLKNVNYGIHNTKELNKKIIPPNVDKNTLITHYFELVKFFSHFKFSNEMINKLEIMLKEKKEIFYKLFNKLIDELIKKINVHLNFRHFQTKYDTFLSISQNMIHYVEDIYYTNSEKVRDYERGKDVDNVISKTGIKEKLNELKAKMQELKKIVNLMESKYNLVKPKEIMINDLINKTSIEVYSSEKRDDLLKTVETLLVEGKGVTNDFEEIYKYYSNTQVLEKKISALIENVNDSFVITKELVEKERKNNNTKLLVNMKVENLIKISNSIQDILSIKKEIKKNNTQIEELIKETSLNVNQFINRKKSADDNISALLHDFNSLNLDSILGEMIKFVDKNKNFIKESHTPEEYKNMLTESNKEYSKIKGINFNGISDVSNKLKEELNNILHIKEDIINQQHEVMEKDMLNTVNQLREQYNNLENMMNNYKGNKEKLEEIKDNVTKIKNKFSDVLNKNVEDTMEEKKIYAKLSELKDFAFQQKKRIPEEINKIKDVAKKIKKQLNINHKMAERINKVTNKAYSEINNLEKDIPEDISESKALQHESDFDNNSKLTDNTIREIDALIKNIKLYKSLNAAINGSTMSNTSIEEIKLNKNILNEKIDEQIKAIEREKLIEETTKTKLLNNLNNEKINLIKNLDETYLNNLSTQIREQLEYYDDSKKTIKNISEAKLAKLQEETNKWADIKVLVDNLTMIYQEINNDVNKLINNQNSEIVNLIDKRLTDIQKKINNKMNMLINSMDQIKIKLVSLDINKYIKENRIRINDGSIRRLQWNLNALEQKITKNNSQLHNFKKRYNEYITKANEQKNNKQDLHRKKDVMKRIYEELSGTYDELSQMEKVDNTLKDVNEVQSEFDKILKGDVTETASDRKEKSENKRDSKASMNNHTLSYAGAFVLVLCICSVFAFMTIQNKYEQSKLLEAQQEEFVVNGTINKEYVEEVIEAPFY
ncbi:reticulocyte binding protein 3 [Plasmodium ovale wallikeri]|uniref:Reticulocyte binding protein 3 n=1 Tax=Plasmodium ovale wallikeri TaxID=864142 RepID=A0A1A8YNE9_PLAOA|nr:reticulocyte binding protein 3 [Plasmodium ovale wallikeri]SBT58884.1 reticulocyte binding protein 3 [Plasmodium ovale wallikeri]